MGTLRFPTPLSLEEDLYFIKFLLERDVFVIRHSDHAVLCGASPRKRGTGKTQCRGCEPCEVSRHYAFPADSSTIDA